MNTAEVILAILIFSLIMNIFFIITRKKDEDFFVEEVEQYTIAIDIFNAWKKEIGGVSLKGVGQHYEKWIWKKLNEAKK